MRSALPVAAMVAACVMAIAIAGCSRRDESAADSAPPALTDTALQAKLCAALRRIAPQLAGMPEVGARAQLVIGVAGAFDSDATALQTVSREIDAIAAAGCAEVRAPLLAATRAASLQEAVR